MPGGTSRSSIGPKCLALLPTVSVARIGVSQDAIPAILPVNFVLHDGAVIIRSGAGSKLAATLANAVVAVEVDDFDPNGRTGWSVLVRGIARVIDDPAGLAAVSLLPLQPWAEDGNDQFIAIDLQLVTGRRVHPTET